MHYVFFLGNKCGNSSYFYVGDNSKIQTEKSDLCGADWFVEEMLLQDYILNRKMWGVEYCVIMLHLDFNTPVLCFIEHDGTHWS